ncbi:MAG: bifunctional GNAT family N-acetyltransferase/carbon-nitrogen hydrolase family protein [Caldilineaceae bacterium]|nr:bifunctional GNAT family N-acetyltransferase/carbon-nitrogen hydrolase family protein [Caldilineaceae bacterium]
MTAHAPSPADNTRAAQVTQGGATLSPKARRKRSKVRVRAWRPDDIAGIIACHRAAYPDYEEEMYYTERFYEMQLATFPEGQVLAEADGKVIGYATSIIVQLDDSAHWYTYEEITGGGTFSTHDPSGDTLYGADIAVHPDYRGLGVAGMLYEQRKRLMKRYNLRRMVAYGRMPGYNAVAGKMTPEEYVQKVVAGELKDSSLLAHLKAGYQVKRILLDFLWDDSSLNYSTWLEMPNPHYRPEKRQIAAAPIQRPVRKIRVCAAQFQMRPIKSWDEFAQTVAFFVDTADTYHCHFLVFPELFTVQLFSLMPPDLQTHVAIRQLAGMHDRYVELFTRFATERDIYIIGGSHPVIRDEELYNVAHLFTPSGHVYTQDALHIPPIERDDFGIEPGEEMKVFDTPLARIAIQVSYDIEFPEVSRLLVLSGAEIIFVPFSTDEKKAYDRIRYTAQARAVENFVYTVITGNVGNLPAARNYLINYGQAAVFTPSDFAFPPSATAGEAEANVETVVITDLDLTSLAQQRELASVRHLYDRRADLYDLRARKAVKLIRTE